MRPSINLEPKRKKKGEKKRGQFQSFGEMARERGVTSEKVLKWKGC